MRKVTVDSGDFWKFKARTTELDGEAVRLRVQLHAVLRHRDEIIDEFAARHGLDARKPMTLEDTDCTVTQDA